MFRTSNTIPATKPAAKQAGKTQTKDQQLNPTGWKMKIH
jgi:hypothetical protein